MTACLLYVDAARPEDAEALGRILTDWARETGWMVRLHRARDDRDHVADLIRTGGVLVVRRGGKALGYVFEADGHIGALYVTSEERGKGCGKLLLDRVKETNDALDLWTFAANKGARRFYAREGFREVERTAGENTEGLPDVRMVWRREDAHE